MKKSSTYSVALVFGFIWTIATRPAFAYLDPGTGSMVFQVALASLFGILLAIKTYWLQIKHFVLSNILHKQMPVPESASKTKKVKP